MNIKMFKFCRGFAKEYGLSRMYYVGDSCTHMVYHAWHIISDGTKMRHDALRPSDSVGDHVIVVKSDSPV